MRSQRRIAQPRQAIRESRWVRTVSCYRITTAYLILAIVILVLLLTI